MLYEAVAEDRLGGAGLDVLPRDSPEDISLTDHEDIIVTSYIAWYSEESFETLRRTVAVMSLTPYRATNQKKPRQRHIAAPPSSVSGLSTVLQAPPYPSPSNRIEHTVKQEGPISEIAR